MDLNFEYPPTYRNLRVACENSHPEIASLILSKRSDVDVNKGSITPLYVASRNGYSLITRAILAKPGTNVNKGSPLYGACAGGHIEIISQLLTQSGIKVNQPMGDETPLYVACEKRNKKAVAMLLGHGANIDDKTKEKHEAFLTQVKYEQCPQRLTSSPKPKREAPHSPSLSSSLSSSSSTSSSSPVVPPSSSSSSSSTTVEPAVIPSRSIAESRAVLADMLRGIASSPTPIAEPEPESDIRLSSSLSGSDEDGTYYTAQYDFIPESSDELTFYEGDLLRVVVDDPSGWAEAVHTVTGLRGWVPINYLERLS
eukprot:TRINITY_DN1459_c0_g1_i1.p1 TRINITY_DN1459_c0_g1~~TRINITY_DN1459_c0_g1_i1.p1  ORF type:complete len:312 (+),score=80.26 TRINITY_DN1459_c0_g1_i1:85-1020(+)